MALGFILFAIFCIILLFFLTIAIFISIFSGKYLLKLNKSEKSKIKLIFSLFGLFISCVIITIFVVIIIRIFILPPGINQILFKTNNDIKEINGITKIKQSIYGYGNIITFQFFRQYKNFLPHQYNIVFYDTSDDVNYIQINTIYLIIDEDKQNIIDKNDRNNIIQYKDYNFEYKLNFDYKTIESLIIFYNLDIRLV